MVGEVEEHVWTLIAAEPPEPAGRQQRTRYARFAWRAEAEEWIREQALEGFSPDPDWPGPRQLATFRYSGPTDSPSNAWAAQVAQEVEG